MHKTIKLKADRVRSLSWQGDDLVDWVSGGLVYSLNGETKKRNVNYAYPFNSAVVSSSGIYAVIFTNSQTKGLVLKNGEIIREINRSYYQAHAYDFPIVFSRLSSGQEVLVYSPKDYCRIDIEEIETGKVLTDFVDRNASDCFHSRLAVSPNGKLLLSAGWVWHPLDVVGLYDLSSSLEDPTILDKPIKEPPGYWEISSAAFLNDTLIFVSTSDEFLGDEDDPDDDRPGPCQIALWSLETNTYLSTISCGHPAGELMPISERYVVSFFEHPKLWDMDSGSIVHEWKQIDSGEQKSSITYGKERPVVAIDSKNRRFSVANDKEILVVLFG